MTTKCILTWFWLTCKKTFHTRNQKVLHDKLLPIGFSKNIISWYQSYLAECYFTAKVANRVSNFGNISCSLLQSTRVGSIQSRIYTTLYALESNLYLYIDYSRFLFQHKKVTEIKKKRLTKDFTNICDWFEVNKQSIHFGEDKMKSILFSFRLNLELKKT